MAKSLLFIGLLALAWILPAWGDSYYCTNSNQLVSTGATTMDSIIQACGNPSKMETVRNREPIDRRQLLQWIYYSKQNVAPWANQVPPELMISFYQDQVESIEVNGQPVDGGINCFGRGMIQPGDFLNKVAMICGKPDAFQRNWKTIMGSEQTTVRLIYQRGDGLPPVIFEVKQGKLAAIRYGS